MDALVSIFIGRIISNEKLGGAGERLTPKFPIFQKTEFIIDQILFIRIYNI